jgi:hypothetical protein
MRFDGLLAEEQRRGDLGVRLAIYDEARGLELALGEGIQTWLLFRSPIPQDRGG